MKSKLSTFLVILFVTLFTQSVSAQSPRERLQIIDAAVKQDARGSYVVEGVGTIKLKNGEMLDGQLMFTISRGLGSQGRVQYFREGRMTPDDFYPSQVAYFQIGEYVFYPLDVRYEGTNYSIFAQLVNNNLDDKMKLYRLYMAEASSEPTRPDILKRAFFIHMQGEPRATQLGGGSLTPFAKSMSKNVADCPDLAKKIKEKEEGYKTAMIDLTNKNDDVYFRILEEYNACKK